MKLTKGRIALGVLLFVLLFGLAGCLTIDKWLFVALDPGAFDPKDTPQKTDYAKASSWASLPTTKDGADVSLKSHPAKEQTKAPVDVFYLHPTTWIGTRWNAPIDLPAVVKGTHRGALLIQASVFNACCAVYAPRYRQATGQAYVYPSEHAKKAIAVAYEDVVRAFRFFRRHYNKGRPFLLAGHSQGTVLALQLLKKEIVGKAAAKDLVAAYLIGGPVHHKDLTPQTPLCQKPTQTGCVIGWNSRGPRYHANTLDFANPHAAKGNKMAGFVCINPLTWTPGEQQAPTTLHKGAVFFDAKAPKLIPHFANAACQKGRLLVTKIGKPERDFMSKLLDWITGPQNYHPIEYQLFYYNIRENAQKRITAFLKRRQTP